MFYIDVFNNKEPLSLYLSTPDKQIITCLNSGVDITTGQLYISLNQQYELTFTYNSKIIDNETGELVESPGYDYIVEGMYLVLERIGLFKMKAPVIRSDGTLEQKEVTAKSCDSELEDKIFTSKINTGEEDAREFLVEYDDDETEMLVNEYTGIPFDWIVLYNTFPEQLQILLADYNKGIYGTANTNITLTNSEKIKSIYSILKLIPRLTTKIIEKSDGSIERSDYVIYTFNDDDEITSIYIDKDFPNRIKELIAFYTKYRDRLSLLTIALEKMEGNWSVGYIYGYEDNDFSVCNKKGSFDANESIYSFLTQTLAQSIECVVYFDIMNRKVNVIPADKIGNDTGIILSYENLINSVNISCDENNLSTRLYVSGADDLGIEQVNYGEDYIDDLTYEISARDTNGKRIYVSDALADKYTAYKKYRDDNRDTWIKYTKEYNQYLNEISDIKNRVPNDDLKNQWGTYSKEMLVKTQTTYNNLLAALETLYKEDYGSVGLNSDRSINEEYIKKTEYWYDYQAYKNILIQLEAAIAVWPNYSDDTKWTQDQRDKYLDKIKEWETDWTLFGIDELTAKIETYNNSIQTLLEKETVCRISPTSEVIKSWSQMTDAEKSKYGSVEQTYVDAYEMYNEYLTNRNSAQKYLDGLNEQLKVLEGKRDTVKNQREALRESVSYKGYFTSDERKSLCLLFKDAEYTNENILTTTIDDSVSAVDVQYDLLKDAQEKLEIYSRPQLTFETELNNLLSLHEFSGFWDDFQVGNYIYIEFRDNTYMKTRLVNYQFNPFEPDINELTIGFSSFIVSKSKRWDITSLLGMSITEGITNYTSSRNGGSGAFGSEYLSDTMLEKLLNSESFGTKVTNVILDTMKVNTLTAQKGVFSSLYGDEFNFANGKLVYKDNVLHLDGILSWDNVDGGVDYVEGEINSAKDDIINEVNNFSNAITNDIQSLQKQIDGQIETYYYDYEPTLNNAPASTWTTNDDKVKHEGDLFYWKTKGFAYRFMNDNGTWKWQLIQDTDITLALRNASKAQDTADCKRRVFYKVLPDHPTPPYDSGDVWVQGKEGDILTCVTGRTESQSYVSSDWILASKYTDDSSLTTFINGDYSSTIKDIQNQTDQKAETWYQSTDPSLSWTTSDKPKHKGDLWYNTSNENTYIYNGSSWEITKSTIPSEMFDTFDGKAFVFANSKDTLPTPPYNVNDIWVQGSNGDILRCVTSRAKGEAANSSDWILASKYTDDSNLKLLEEALGCEKTTITKDWAFSPHIIGGDITIGNKSGIYASIDKDGNLFANSATIKGNIDASTIKAKESYSLYNGNSQTKIIYYDPTYTDADGNQKALRIGIMGDGTSVMNGCGFELLEKSAIFYGKSLNFYSGSLNCQGISCNGNLLTGTLGSTDSTNNNLYVDANMIINKDVFCSNSSIEFGDYTSSVEKTTYGKIRTGTRGKWLGGEVLAANGGDAVATEITPVIELYGEDAANIMIQNRSVLQCNDEVTILRINPVILDSRTTFRANINMRYVYDVVAFTDCVQLGLDQDAFVRKIASSSKRYKDHIGQISSSDISKFYDLNPVWFKYKEGYLSTSDTNYNKPVPGFYAEEVAECFPSVAKYKDGKIEDWNERMLIPYMVKAMKDMKEEIESLKDEINILKSNA